MNAYAAAKEMALHYARKHLAIIKNSEFSREDKVKLIKIWLRLYNIPQRLKNKKKFYKCQCGRFYNGIKCNECGYSGDPVDATTTSDKHEPEQTNAPQTKAEKYAETLKKYKSTNNHYTPEQVLISAISMDEALERGFEEQFCGIKCYFTNILRTKINIKHPLENKRKNIIYAALIQQKTFTNIKSHKNQLIIYQAKRFAAKNGKRIFIIIDEDTGIVNSVLKANQEYAKKHFGITT